MEKLLKNIHPGEILMKECLEPLDMRPEEFSKKAGMPYATLVGILNGKALIMPNVAMKLSDFFETSVEFWLGMQMDYDVQEVRRHRMRARLKRKPTLKKKKTLLKRKRILTSR